MYHAKALQRLQVQVWERGKGWCSGMDFERIEARRRRREMQRRRAAVPGAAQERLRRVELERHAAQARAVEAAATAAEAKATAERRARWRTAWLAAWLTALLLGVAAGGSAGWFRQQKHQAANSKMTGDRALLTEGRRGRLTDVGRASEEWALDAERLVALDRNLAAVTKVQGQPADAAERLALAQHCRQSKQPPRAAARLYTEAFTAEPKLATDLCSGQQYNAACAVALAAGQGEGAMKLADEGHARLRQQALGWLRADLVALSKMAGDRTPQDRQFVVRALRHWHKSSDLASLRDKDALDKLPAAEREAWQQLWADVGALLQRAQEK
jgi:hypothetical protein